MPNQKRETSEPKDIEDIDPKNDIRVRIIGTVLEKEEDSIMIDDGTGSTEAFLDKDDLEDLEEGEHIRILGRVLPTPDSFEIQGEIIQKLKNVDIELYKQVKNKVST